MSTTTTNAPYLTEETAQKLVERITALKESDRGRYAALKRNAGNPLEESRGCFWFYEFVPPWIQQEDRLLETAFLVATLIPINRYSSSDSMPKALKRIRPGNEQGRDAMDRRFGILLDADFVPGKDNELAFRLRQIVKLLASKQVGINWASLMKDLSEWNFPNKRVQKKWARDYFSSEKSEDNADAYNSESSNLTNNTTEEQ
jgi:CRISPR system Cascade subunit CasB